MATVDCAVEADQAVLTVAGEIDVAAAEAFRTAGLDCLERAGSVLLVDLADVNFMDSSGLGALVALRNRAEAKGQQVVLRAVSRRVRQVLVLSHLDEVFPIAD